MRRYGVVTTALMALAAGVAIAQPESPPPPAMAPSIAATPLPATQMTSPPIVTLAPPPPPVVDPMEAPFRAYLTGFRSRAITFGIRPETVDAILPGLTYNPRVVALDRAQPGVAGGTPQLFSDYLARHVGADTAAIGKRKLADLGPQLAAIERTSGVPASVLGAIWGMETAYGSYLGDFDLFRSLATLAFDGRRRPLFEKELIAALTLVDRGIVSRDKLVGSWAGATGQPQFMPSVALKLARDGDGDGRADIWTSAPDALASIGAYLANAGWRPGLSWGMKVVVPYTLDRSRVKELVRSKTCSRVLAQHSRWIPISEWKALGVIALDKPWPADDVLATLVEPDGPAAPGYLTFGNYRAILDYNCSNYYALSVGLLSDALAR
jgi:membrane-bound lytic murein transglycosylase B